MKAEEFEQYDSRDDDGRPDAADLERDFDSEEKDKRMEAKLEKQNDLIIFIASSL
jgi:hypothetical protein